MRVLIADDQPSVRSALRLLVEQLPEATVVGDAADGAWLQVLLRTAQPDLLLLDWGLPKLAATSSLDTLRAACPKMAIIVLSGDLDARSHALAAGADAFVSKSDPPQQVVAVLESVLVAGSQ